MTHVGANTVPTANQTLAAHTSAIHSIQSGYVVEQPQPSFQQIEQSKNVAYMRDTPQKVKQASRPAMAALLPNPFEVLGIEPQSSLLKSKSNLSNGLEMSEASYFITSATGDHKTSSTINNDFVAQQPVETLHIQPGTDTVVVTGANSGYSSTLSQMAMPLELSLAFSNMIAPAAEPAWVQVAPRKNQYDHVATLNRSQSFDAFQQQKSNVDASSFVPPATLQKSASETSWRDFLGMPSTSSRAVKSMSAMQERENWNEIASHSLNSYGGLPNVSLQPSSNTQQAFLHASSLSLVPNSVIEPIQSIVSAAPSVLGYNNDSQKGPDHNPNSTNAIPLPPVSLETKFSSGVTEETFNKLDVSSLHANINSITTNVITPELSMQAVNSTSSTVPFNPLLSVPLPGLDSQITTELDLTKSNPLDAEDDDSNNNNKTFTIDDKDDDKDDHDLKHNSSQFPHENVDPALLEHLQNLADMERQLEKEILELGGMSLEDLEMLQAELQHEGV
jgi:hypothetical protein